MIGVVRFPAERPGPLSPFHGNPMTRFVEPFLMFQGGDAEAAMRFYVSLFEGGEILELTRHPLGAGVVEGKVMRGVFSIGGQTVRCSDSPPIHPFGFTPSVSLLVECDSEGELERLSAALNEGGQVLMPLGDYGFSKRFTWVNDRFGVSWQLNLA
jgi:predicted 3-demethylubiquinone-9 3-methyltransferase (glyoxalase superfamily)